MRRARSALAAIGGFGVAIAFVSVGTTASIVLLMPDPPIVRMTVAQAAAALRGPAGTLQRVYAPPPSGAGAPVLQHTLARALGLPRASVRVVWLNSSPSRWFGGTGKAASDTKAGVATPFVFKSGGLGIPTPEGFTIQMGQARSLQSMDATFDRLILSLQQPPFAASIRDADGRWITVRPRRSFFDGWRSKVLIAMAVSLMLLAPFAWLFARRFTRPFRALAKAIRENRSIPAFGGPRELSDAAEAIVQLRSRMAADAEERMRMLNAVAHDLRTPLTSLKLRIEGVPEPQRTRMAADAARMQAMIHEVLTFARAAAATRVTVPVRSVVSKMLATMPLGEAKVTLSAGADPLVTVVEPAFQRALENLLRNAVDYAGGGRIDVAYADDIVTIDMVDHGPGIAPQDRARLILPFERGDASRSRDTGGIGLGLSIVKDFAELHGGSLILTETPKGGTTASLRLPAS